MNEFLNRASVSSEVSSNEELDVQKAVVESLAADKAEQDEQIVILQNENHVLRNELSKMKVQIDEMKATLANVGDVLSKNSEVETSNKVSLIDRNLELDDRFQGETRDHVLEVIREARDSAEQDGRLRRAQILESVLVVNEPNGKLAEKRASLERFFNDNGNIMSGPVIAQLEKLGISHKNGETYLLPREILKRTY